MPSCRRLAWSTTMLYTASATQNCHDSSSEEMDMQTRSGILKGGLAGGALSLLGCLGILAVVALCVGGLFFLITGSFRSSDVYQEALTAAQNDPEVQAED